MQNESVLRITRRFSALVVALSLPLASAFAAVSTVPSESFVPPPVAPERPAFINTLLPIAPTNGLDQRLVPSLSTPAAGSLITVTPGAPLLGIAPGGPGGSEAACTMGRDGLALSLAQGNCAGVVNFPKANDLLN
jgi:hypothetical protein